MGNNTQKKIQPDYMTDAEIDAYYASFDSDNMSRIDAKRLLDSRIPHYNSERQKNRLLYDWLLRKLSGLPMWDYEKPEELYKL